MPLLERLEDPEQERRDRRERVAAAAVPDFVDDLLGAVERRRDVFLRLEAELRDLRPGVDQPAQARLLAHDPRVVFGRGRGRHCVHQRVDVGHPADLVEQTAVLELAGERDFVERVAAVVKRAQGRVDLLV